MPDIDLFNSWRIVLGWVVGIYATVVTFQSLWGWYIWLTGSDKYISLIRQYVIVHGLRLRFKTFWGDVLICILLTIAFCLLWYAHFIMTDLGAKLADARRFAQAH